MRRSRLVLIAVVGLALLLVAACSIPVIGRTGSSPTPPPSRTPKPTFTPTPAGTRTIQELPTNEPGSVATSTSTEPTPTPEPPTPTPPSEPVVLVNVDTLNVRSGPSTQYDRIGKVSRSTRLDVVGKNSSESWWKICCVNGQEGWVFAEMVTREGDYGNIALAPIPPTPTTIPVTPTPVPPTPIPATPKPAYEYNKGLVQRCDPNPGVTYVEGTVYRNHQPFNGARVVFSYAPDGPLVTQPVITGPHEGYLNWNDGFYSHIIGSNEARAGNWYIWVVDSNNRRISVTVHLETHGDAGAGRCQQAVIDFDTS